MTRVQGTFIRDCLLTERRLFHLVIALATISMLSLLVITALALFDYQLSIWGLWYLGLFTSIGLSVTLFLTAIVGCLAHWTRSASNDQAG